MRELTAKEVKSLETKIIKAIVTSALALGHKITVYDGEEYTVKRSTSFKTIVDALRTTGEDQLVIRDSLGICLGTISLVYGNDGYDVVSDHTDNVDIDAIIAPSQIIIDTFAAAHP